MKKFSEAKCLAHLALNGVSNLSTEEIYRAAVFTANSGRMIMEASHLSLPMRLLLDVRVLIAQGQIEQAEHLLLQISKISDLEDGVLGDIPYLLGMIAFSRGQVKNAGKLMNEAKSKYLLANDLHRALRSLINQEIAKEELSSYSSGAINALFLQTQREQIFDLAGNIKKSEAIDALNEGNLSQANAAALSAIENYQKDSCPIDQSIARCLGAMTSLLMGKAEEAFAIENSIVEISGRVKGYYDIWSTVKAGKKPKPDSAGVLAQTNWEKLVVRDQSITGKIIARLKQGPATKYQLIEYVWGKEADNTSYEARLYSALYQIKKNSGAVIKYNGDAYIAV